ncbi:MAG: MFS transporter [Saprospiraceae bacterium]
MSDLSTKRISLSLFFFLSGFCFASWTSRIPTIKNIFDLNDAQLGNLLLAMPISSLIGLPVSGWLVSKFDSRVPLRIAFIFYCIALIAIGCSDRLIVLIMSVCFFAFCMRILNISMNTQSIMLQKEHNKKINGSFHGLWSTGGLLGVLFTTFMVRFNITMQMHFIIVALITVILVLIAYPYLLKNDRTAIGNKIIIGKPDTFILLLGMMVFLSAICEGGMFDWSGVYFRDVVKQEIFTLGYLIFMIFMAGSRFYSDRLIGRIGMEKTYLLSASLIASGITLVVLFPMFWTVLIGFSITGMGVASVIPMTFTLAGRSSKYSPGMAISLIATYGIAGMLIGPPLIGYIAHWLGLKFSFILFILSGMIMIPMSKLIFKKERM